MPHMGLQLTTLRSRVARSTDWTCQVPKKITFDKNIYQCDMLTSIKWATKLGTV